MSFNKRFDSVTVFCPMAIVIDRDQMYHFEKINKANHTDVGYNLHSLHSIYIQFVMYICPTNHSCQLCLVDDFAHFI